MPSRQITIVGAGLAGLTLGRCLKQYGVAATILEKVSSSPLHNYAITLHPWAYQPLLSILQIDERTFREQVSIDHARRAIGEVSWSNIAPSIRTTHSSLRCHRGRLEKLLQEGQDIRWGHNVQDVEAPLGTNVIIHMQDQKTMGAEVLVGVDGVHSRVRKSLAPGVGLKILPYVVFNGKRRLSVDEYQDLIAPAMQDGLVLQSRCEDAILEISVNDFTSDRVDLSYTYSRPARKSDPLHNPDRPTSGATNIPEALYTELGQLNQLERPFDIIFNPAKLRNDRILHWLMRSTLGSQAEIRKLAGQGVLLIGDAIHAMPILGGEGANTAIKDGVDLAQHIVHHGTSASSLQAFANAKYMTWMTRVEESEERLWEMHDRARASL